jgi:hypothetical protein
MGSAHLIHSPALHSVNYMGREAHAPPRNPHCKSVRRAGVTNPRWHPPHGADGRLAAVVEERTRRRRIASQPRIPSPEPEPETVRERSFMGRRGSFAAVVRPAATGAERRRKSEALRRPGWWRTGQSGGRRGAGERARSRVCELKEQGPGIGTAVSTVTFAGDSP